MQKLNQQKLLSSSGLLAALTLLILINLVASLLFSSARLDLTENNLYTLSDGTESILEKLEEPVSLRFYFSEKAFAAVPAIMTYGQRIKDLLKEYASIGGSHIRLQFIDPEPFSEEEDQAVQYQLQGVPLDNAGTTGYFGIVATNSVDEKEVIPFLQPEKEVSLEYDLTRLVYKLSHPKKQQIGLISSLEMSSTPQSAGPMSFPQEWMILNQLRQFFEIKKLSEDVDKIDADIDVLMVVHPKNLAAKTVYAIDQFVLNGGRAMVFVDPFAESDIPPQDPSNPMAAMQAPRSSNMAQLFAKWGVALDVNKIAADRLSAARVTARVGQRVAPVDYVAWLQLREPNFNQQDFVTGELKQIAMATTGFFTLKDIDGVSHTPLLETSDQAAELAVSQVQFGPNPMALLRSYRSGDKKLPLAVRISGKLKSAFDKPPEGAVAGKQLNESVDSSNVIVVADTDMLDDRMWVDVQNFFGQRLAVPRANNDAFLINAIENLSGSNDLISLRSRDRAQRPFTKVMELKQEAEARFRDTESQLQARLRETERKLSELQKQKGGGDNMILSAQQQAELDKFRDQQLQTRKELRQVQHALGQDIEDLGNWLKFFNIAFMPLLIILSALTFLFYRNKRLKGA